MRLQLRVTLAMAAPIPLDAPVTTATLPLSLLMFDSFQNAFFGNCVGLHRLRRLFSVLADKMWAGPTGRFISSEHMNY